MANWNSDELVDQILQSYEAHPESTRLSGEGLLNRDLPCGGDSA